MFLGKKKERAKGIRQKRNKILKLVTQNKQYTGVICMIFTFQIF